MTDAHPPSPIPALLPRGSRGRSVLPAALTSDRYAGAVGDAATSRMPGHSHHASRSARSPSSSWRTCLMRKRLGTQPLRKAAAAVAGSGPLETPRGAGLDVRTEFTRESRRLHLFRLAGDVLPHREPRGGIFGLARSETKRVHPDVGPRDLEGIGGRGRSRALRRPKRPPGPPAPRSRPSPRAPAARSPPAPAPSDSWDWSPSPGSSPPRRPRLHGRATPTAWRFPPPHDPRGNSSDPRGCSHPWLAPERTRGPRRSRSRRSNRPSDKQPQHPRSATLSATPSATRPSREGMRAVVSQRRA